MKAAKEDTTNACRHHWVIEEANGPTSPGRCKRCGATGQFPNSSPPGWQEQRYEKPVI